MKVFHRWMRSAGLVPGAAVLAVTLLGAAPTAQATDITNPAEHPAPITVTIDGQTYHDGADTLPGYDDYACTPIPNVQYDFADDEIQYYSASGDLITTADWTEWSRISSYQTWLDQQHAASNPAPGSGDTTPTTTSTTSTSTATTSPAATSPAATSPAATSPGATSTATTGTTTKTTTAATKTKSAATKTTTSTAKTKSTSSSATKTKSSATTTKSAAGTTPSSSHATSSTPKQTTTSHAKQHGTSTASPAKDGTTTNQPAGAAPAGGGSGPSAGGTSAAPASGSTAGVAPTAQGTAAPSSTSSAAGAPKYKLVSDRTGAGGSIGDTRPVGVGILVAVFAMAGLGFLFGFGRRGARGRHS